MPAKTFPVPPVVRSFSGPQLLQIAMPLGGIGAGCICLNGNGGLQDFALRHKPATTALADGWGFMEAAFATLRVAKPDGSAITRLVEGPMPVEKIYDQGLQAQGYRHGGYEGLPRMATCSFHGAYPFGRVSMSDPKMPVEVELVGWSPFIPLDDHNSSLPSAILEYTLTNRSSEPLSLQFAYHLSNIPSERRHSADESKPAAGTVRRFGENGIIYANAAEPNAGPFGTAALVVGNGLRARVKATWFRGGWFDPITALWREVSSGQFVDNDGPETPNPHGLAGASILVEATLKPGETVAIPIIIAWHFPNATLAAGRPKDSEPVPTPAWRPYYAAHFADAGAVATHVSSNYESLRSRTLAFTSAVAGSSIPVEVTDAVLSNLAILKSPTVLRLANGNVWAWEGCFTTHGSCHGTCTHVWNYAQALPHLFPTLERGLREQELLRSMDDRGHVNFRAALPEGPNDHLWNAAADGQLGGICKVFRDWQIGGDTTWLSTLYPHVKRSIEFCIHHWDPEEKGGLFEPHHNTYDIEFWGPDGMCGSIYVAALTAMAAMAKSLGHNADAERYGTLARRAATFTDENLFNGEYYNQWVMWADARDRGYVKSLTDKDTSPELLALLKSEGPRYQYGNGCLSDGVIGGWMAGEYGIDVLLDRKHVRSTLAAIFKHNFKQDLFEHVCLQRPGYAMGHEPGLVICTWPHDDKPTLPFVYSDEVWTGIEYQVASHLIREGMVEEGLTIVRAVRSRYEGHVRNPFNEYECGSYYARALASYAVLTALSGVRYSAVEQTLWVDPKVSQRPFRCFFSTVSGYGMVTLTDRDLTIELIEGALSLRSIRVGMGSKSIELPSDVVVRSGTPWRSGL